MKKIWYMLVVKTEGTRMESLLNHFRVGLNDWDKTKTFQMEDGTELVGYTIMCTEETFVSITEMMNGTRVF